VARGGRRRTIAAAALVLLAAAAARAADLAGSIEGGAYVGPDRTFRVAVPPLSAGDPVLRERRPAPGVWLVEIGDDLCRRFVVSERRVAPGDEALPDWVERVVVAEVRDAGGEALSLGPAEVGEARIPAIRLRYRQPGYAPCLVYRSRDGFVLTRPERPGRAEEAELDRAGFEPVAADAEMAMDVFRAGGRVYRLIYALGADLPRPPPPPRVEPVEAVLDMFAAGFEALKPQP
jgi:hypothetical protein